MANNYIFIWNKPQAKVNMINNIVCNGQSTIIVLCKKAVDTT